MTPSSTLILLSQINNINRLLQRSGDTKIELYVVDADENIQTSEEDIDPDFNPVGCALYDNKTKEWIVGKVDFEKYVKNHDLRSIEEITTFVSGVCLGVAG